MFLIYFLKVMVIIVAYLAFFMSAMILLNYVKEALVLAAYNENPKPIAFVAKGIVFIADIIFLVGSAIEICLTFGWQKSMVFSIKETVMQQPVFGVVIVILALYPTFYIRRLAESQTK